MRTRSAARALRGEGAAQRPGAVGGTDSQATLSAILGILDGLGIQASPEQPLAEAGLDSLGKQIHLMSHFALLDFLFTE